MVYDRFVSMKGLSDGPEGEQRIREEQRVGARACMLA